MEQRVVIAGAGPVGLWLAAELRLGGVPVTVVEERHARDGRSKALGVHPRTTEILASRGVHRALLAEGIPLPGGHFGMLEEELDYRALDTPFPYMLALPQERTEELLEEHARSLGADLRRGHRVTGLDERADAVDVRIEGPEGAYALDAAYAVGCDGTRSTVRTAAGIDFPGTPSTVLGWLGDVVLDSPPELGFRAFGQAGALIVAPLPDGMFRLVGIARDDLRTDWPGELTFDELRAKVLAIAGRDFGMRDPVWLSRFGNATRLAARYRRGRVLLAGDAAHQHFPTGGVGMNVGIQDAHNLGWKLAATLRGWAPGGLLDTYDAERRPVGVDLVEASRAQIALMTSFSPESMDLRALLSRMIATQPSVNRSLTERLSGLAVRYASGDAAAHPLTGVRAPDLALAGDAEDVPSLSGIPRADGYVLLDLTGAGDSPLGSLARAGVTVRSAALREPPASWEGVRAVLLRPDGHLAWVGTASDGAQLAEGARRALASGGQGLPHAA